MQITYAGPLEEVALPDGQTVKPGQSVTVAAALGESLLDQSVWTSKPVKSSPTPKAAKPSEEKN